MASRILRELHESAKGLYDAGAIDITTMLNIMQERCVECDLLTENGGEPDPDSLYLPDGSGPFCNACFNTFADEYIKPLNSV